MSTKKQRLSNHRKQQVSSSKKKNPTENHRNKKKQQNIRKSGGLKQKKSSPKKAQRKQHKRKRRQRVLMKELFITVGIFLLLLGITLGLTVQLPKVEGYSMTPTINDQDRLFVLKKGEVRRFSLISFKNSSEDNWMIRRVVGLPGEKLYYQNGSLFINGEEIPERFLSTTISEISEDPQTANFTLEEVAEVSRVPEDSYFVMGDNRLYATDSRYFGFIKKKNITGVVKARIFPIHAMRQF